MKLNKRGFTLVELLTVMVILITILLIAIPSITSSLSRSENKQLEAQKASIVSDVVINIKRKDFDGSYDSFKNESCTLTVEQLLTKGYITKTEATDKNGNNIAGCVGYDAGDLVFIEDNRCDNECAMK